MQETLENILNRRFQKAELIALINSDNLYFEQAITFALADQQPESWRSAWGLFHCIKSNDKRLQDRIGEIIEAIKTKKDGHQRELLKILGKMNLSDEHEGYLFDICMTIWETVNKSPSVRIVAFRVLTKIAKKYPELNNEIGFLTQRQYTETLSPGIRHSFNKIIAQ